MSCVHIHLLFFFFNDTATTEIYTLSLHDALPISTIRFCSNRTVARSGSESMFRAASASQLSLTFSREGADRSEEHTSESSHSQISYAVFCLKKKKTNTDSSVVSNTLCTHTLALSFSCFWLLSFDVVRAHPLTLFFF